MNKETFIIDYSNKAIKGYTTAKHFKKQVKTLKNLIGDKKNERND